MNQISTAVNHCNEIKLDQEYYLIRNFVDLSECSKLCEEADNLVNMHYTEKNVQNHVALIADRIGNVGSKKGMDFYFFVVHGSKESDSRLPGLQFTDLGPLLQKVSKLAEFELKIRKGRFLLSIARYYQESIALPLHFDHDAYSLVRNEGREVIIEEAIVPNKVAVLTLINDAVGGGTKLSSKDKLNSMVLEYNASDLLIFNNTNVLHGTEEFKENSNFKPPYIRYTIGWRSLDYDCSYLNIREKNTPRPLTYKETVEKHHNFLQNKWPHLLAYLKSFDW